MNRMVPLLSSQQLHKVEHYNTHFMDELTEVLRGQVLGQETQQGLECMSM